MFDQVAAAKVDLTSHWDLKVEGHFIDGFSSPSSFHGFYPQDNPAGLKPTTNMIDLRTGWNLCRWQNSGDSPMRNIARLIITAAICTVILSAADVKVIANSSVGVSSITAEKLKNVFLMTQDLD